jgi:hypothetical protein
MAKTVRTDFGRYLTRESENEQRLHQTAKISR